MLKKAVNLVLSGGAARGVAHIGVIKALEELGFEIKAVSGVSAGALVGAFYCAGYSPEEMLKLVLSKEWLSYIRPKIPRMGLFSLDKAGAYLRKRLHVERIEELKRELWITALDIRKGQTMHFNKGELYPLLLGSCALPGIFEPVKYGSYLLVDGGITNNLPVEPFLERDELLVGVDVNKTLMEERVGNIFQVLIKSFLLAVRSNVDKRKEHCHVLIEPELSSYSVYDLWKAKEIYLAGYSKTLEVMKAYGAY